MNFFVNVKKLTGKHYLLKSIFNNCLSSIIPLFLDSRAFTLLASQGKGELFSPLVMGKRVELWSRECEHTNKAALRLIFANDS